MYILRLDDASEYWNANNWIRIHDMLKKYDIKPIIALIPNCKDEKLMSFGKDCSFWDKMESWIKKDGWIPSLHGYDHVLTPCDGGLNPVNYRTEFVGLPKEKQIEKVTKGLQILRKHDICPQIFVAPAHTFDSTTIEVIRENDNLKAISDTIANDVYYENGVVFIPSQCGNVRKIPLKVTTFCYHPNTMDDESFDKLETFVMANRKLFDVDIDRLITKKRKKRIFDRFLSVLYFLKKKIARGQYV